MQHGPNQQRVHNFYKHMLTYVKYALALKAALMDGGGGYISYWELLSKYYPEVFNLY